MNRTRIMLATFVDLDPTPGPFHTADSARSAVNGILKHQIGHYSPVVSVISHGRQMYNLVLDHNNANWNGTPEYVQMFVKQTMNHMNDMLAHKGFLFLNDVYNALGFPKTREGQLVGWTEDPISFDYELIGSNVDISFFTEGCIIDKAFLEDDDARNTSIMSRRFQ